MIKRLFLLSYLMIISGASYAGIGDCERHYYNNSEETWSFVIKGLDDTVSFTLEPKKSHTLNYTGIFVPKVTEAFLTITGPSYHEGFEIEGTLDCVYIRHDGSTGPVSLNSPADGDVTIN